MKGCEFEIKVLGICNELPDNICLSLDNDGVRGGLLDKVEKSLSKFDSSQLITMYRGYSSENVPMKCKVRKLIADATLNVILDRVKKAECESE